MNISSIFITGIAGFIGFHTAKALLEQGAKVSGCDNFNDYYDPELKRRRAEILKKMGANVLDLDIRNIDQVPNNFTHILHLAAQAGVRYNKPNAYLDSNLDGFLQILEYLKEKPDTKFCFASSSSIYGANTKTPFAETDTTDSPTSLYGATKKANELMAYAYHHLYKIPTIGLRFFTVYGPYGRPDMAYYSFSKKILANEPITLYAEGKLKRDFTYIDDIVSGIIKALEYETTYQIFNLGNNQPETTISLLNTLETLLEKKAHIIHEPAPLTDVHTTYADITKAQTQLGFAPNTTLQAGLTHFIDWFRAPSEFRE